MKTAPHSVLRNWLAPLCLGLTLPLSAAVYGGCKKEEPPPPLPSAAPATTPSAPVELAVEDSGPDVEDASDADADAAKKGTGVPGASMKACCNALAQNAASAPPPTNMYMQAAAAACSAAVAQSKDKSTISGIVSGALKGAQMPAACR